MRGIEVDELSAASARAIVEAQVALDQAGRESFERWDDTGAPPSVFLWRTCAVRIPVSLRVTGKAEVAQRTIVRMLPATSDTGTLTLCFRYAPKSQHRGQQS